MKISGRKCCNTQQTFWPQPITRMAETRNHCGEFGEALTAMVTRGARLKTDGTADYCPDLRHAEHQYSECKSVGKNNAAILYEGRRLKDRRFVTGEDETGPGVQMLFYWFWHHNCAAKAARDVDELRQAWAAGLRYGVMLPFPVVDRLAERCPLKVLNRGRTRGGKINGYGSLAKGYRDGRSLPMPLLLGAADECVMIGPMDLQGVMVGPIPLHFVSRFAFLIR